MKQESSKRWIIRHSILHKHSRVDSPNWLYVQNSSGQNSKENKAQIFVKALNFALDTPKKTFSKPPITATRVSTNIRGFADLVGRNSN